jgi:hypothetical protein
MLEGTWVHLSSLAALLFANTIVACTPPHPEDAAALHGPNCGLTISTDSVPRLLGGRETFDIPYTPERDTESGLRVLNDWVEKFILANECAIPDSLPQAEPTDSLLRARVAPISQFYYDGWNRLYRYTKTLAGYEIRSSGIDGIFFSRDDYVLSWSGS